ncbi:MAG: hypothetical protein IPG04_35190 [Polyangiaceae bacterium]|jgi:hypothetical protein|nr:hypothetical protein [Polyangiaceae bacterium]
MTAQRHEDKSGEREQTSVDSTPDAILAQKVIDALVADGLVSRADGAKIRADLAEGKVDSGSWKLVLENQLEREARPDERK